MKSGETSLQSKVSSLQGVAAVSLEILKENSQVSRAGKKSVIRIVDQE